MTARQPFAPSYGSGQTVTPAAASATATIAKGAKQLTLTNLGINVCYIRVGDANLGSATTADFPIPPSWQIQITKFEDYDKISYISAAGTTLHIINGEGF